MDKEKLIVELERLLVECVRKQTNSEDFSDKWYRAGGQISVINNLLGSVKAGRFD